MPIAFGDAASAGPSSPTITTTTNKGKANMNTNTNANAFSDGTGGRPYPYQPSPKHHSSLKAEEVVKGLKEALKGSTAEVLGGDHEAFLASATIYNGAIPCAAFAVVKPRNAEHVSKVVKFCRKHNLEISVKAGGTGVHGMSLAGHIVIDLCLLKEVYVALVKNATSLEESYPLNSHRPSISSGPNSKRSADFLGDGDQSGSIGRTKLNNIDTSVADDDGDVQIRSAGNSIDQERSSSGCGSRSGTNSGSASGTESINDRGSISTTATSRTSGGSFDSKSVLSSSAGPSARSRSDPVALPRTTYVNPSPTVAMPRTTYVNPSPTITSNNYPFVSSNYGSGYSAASSYTGPLNFGAVQQMGFNTSPNAPPYTIVTFGAGTHSKELDAVTAASPYGAFHVPTSAFPVGAGQFLSGGFGFIGRKHGLAMDNIVEAEIVLADGRVVWVGENGAHGGEWKDGESPSDLWFAIRGAGATFGIVTRYRAKAHYLPSVYAGNFIYMYNPATTPSLLRHVRDCIKGAGRTVYTNIIMSAGPPGAPAIVVIQLCFSGDRAEGDRYVQAIGSWADDRCLFQDFSDRSFVRQQVAVEEVLRDGRGRKWYVKADMLKSLDDEVIDQTCERFGSVPDGCTWLFEWTGSGAVMDTKDSCFPSTHREAAFTVAALHQCAQSEPPPLEAQCVSTAEEWITQVIHPHSPGGPLPCFLQSNELAEVSGTFASNFDRLCELKKLFDPTNFFKHSTWLQRAGAGGVESLPDGMGKDLPECFGADYKKHNGGHRDTSNAAGDARAGSGSASNSVANNNKSGEYGNSSSGGRASNSTSTIRRANVAGQQEHQQQDESGRGLINGNGNGDDGSSAMLEAVLNGKAAETTFQAIGKDIDNAATGESGQGRPRPGTGLGEAEKKSSANEAAGVNIPKGQRKAATVVDPIESAESQVM